MIRQALSALCAGVVMAMASACARDADKPLAPGCREGPARVMTALRAAPAEVRVDGTPLSECLDSARDGGQLRDVGTGYVLAAQRLADRAERAPEGPAAVQLGYLIGAVRRVSHPSQGPSYELVRRIEDEAKRADTSTRAFRRGLRAGRAGG